jgi:hypothetical protein
VVALDVTFSSIPATYTHLQIRAIVNLMVVKILIDVLRFNGDTGANYYTYHSLYGNGSSAYADVSNKGYIQQILY